MIFLKKYTGGIAADKPVISSEGNQTSIMH